jgi:hypothetical protein
MEEVLRAHMEDICKRAASQGQWRNAPSDDSKLVIESIEMSTHADKSVLYPYLNDKLPNGMVYTGGGITPIRASAPVETIVVKEALGTQPGVETTQV